MQLSKGHVMDGDESSLIQLANGSLLLSIRPAIGSKCHCRAVSRSDDSGLSWSNMAWVPELISSRCQGSMMRCVDSRSCQLKQANPFITVGFKTIVGFAHATVTTPRNNYGV